MNKIVSRALAPLAVLASPAVFAQAALPTGVDAAITNAGDVMVLGATAVIVAMVAFWGVKKLGTKLGWF